ncbi:uncharacterized protein LOC134000078 [Scomber scombrus]|uniref:uncharacterized protein LOC134000078 n=1 Tax=Scomber scombrus TaxID=13677 RepID=UPI002DD8DE8D|nr:uncharacterized protein LOC134000078 [Scomber scombrus]
MTVHLFGAVSSPSCACYALRKTAEDNQNSFPAEVTDTVKQKFYMDDCLKSLPSEEEAVEMQGEPVHQSIVSCAWRGQPSFISLLESGMDAELEFYTRIIERFCLPPDAKLVYKDATGTEVDEDIFSDLVSQGNVTLSVFSNDGEKCKGLIEDVLGTSSGGEEVLQEYHTTQTLTDATRRKLVNIIVAHMIDKHGQLPSKAVREEYALGIVTVFPSLKDPYSKKGYINQHFTLLFEEEVSNLLLQKWDPFFRVNVIKEAKRLTPTPELRRMLQAAESPGSELDEAPRGPRFPKISASDAVERLVVFHKSCCSLEEHLQSQQNQQPYLLAVGRQKRKIDNFYVSIDKHLIPCQATRSIGAFDELFKAHFVFNVSYDGALVNFYTFLQTTVYNIDMGKMKESPRVRDLRAKLLNQEVVVTI